MCWIHTWEKWEQYDHTMPSIYEGSQVTQYQRRQRRHCKVCNKEEDEFIRDGKSNSVD